MIKLASGAGGSPTMRTPRLDLRRLRLCESYIGSPESLDTREPLVLTDAWRRRALLGLRLFSTDANRLCHTKC
jgi:hypothetical protein